MQESSFVPVSVEFAQGHMSSATLTLGDFTKNSQPISPTPRLWAARQQLLSPEGVHLCHCKLGELRRLATASSPDFCARVARIASRINSLQGSDIISMT